MADEFQGGVCGGNVWNISRNFLGPSPCSMVVNDIGWPNNQDSMIMDTISSSKSNLDSTGSSSDIWNQNLLFDDENYIDILQEATCLNSSMMNYLQETSFIDCPQILVNSSMMINSCTITSDRTVKKSCQEPSKTPKFPMASSFVSQRMSDIDSQLQESFSPLNNMIDNNNKFNISSINANIKPSLHSSSVKINEEASVTNVSVAKRPRIEPLPTFKVRKEKFGDRVTALQQLVSPFGKTDTASVLHEATEYIKFLHDQVKTLSAPYLENGSARLQLKQVITDHNNNDQEEQILSRDLRSRGLCLVPMSSTFPIEAETSADFWTPMFGSSFR